MMPGQVPTSRRGVASAILRLGFAAGILVYLFRSVPASQVRAVLGRADLAWVAAALGLGLLSQVLVAMRLRIVTNAYALSLTTFDVFEINLATRFYGLFLPGGGATATAVRVVKLARLKKDHAPTLYFQARPVERNGVDSNVQNAAPAARQLAPAQSENAL